VSFRCFSRPPAVTTLFLQGRSEVTYRLDAPVQDGLVDEVQLAQFTDEFDVAEHLELGDGALLLLLRGQRGVIFVID